MKNNHVIDVEIQQYVLNKEDCDSIIIEHINNCQKCKNEVEIYELLFASIKKEPKMVFEFDIANLVMQKLHKKQNFSFDKYLIAILSSFMVTVVSILIYITNKYFPTVLNEISTIHILLITVTILLISIFIYIDMNENYKKQMNFS